MRGKLFYRGLPLGLAALFLLVGCANAPLTADQRTQAQASPNSLVREIMGMGYVAVNVSVAADMSEPFPQQVEVLFKKCVDADLDKCAQGVSPVKTPAVYFNAQVFENGQLEVLGIRSFQSQASHHSVKFTCLLQGTDVDRITFADGVKAVAWASEYNRGGRPLLDLTTVPGSKVAWNCHRG